MSQSNDLLLKQTGMPQPAISIFHKYFKTKYLQYGGLPHSRKYTK